MFLIPLENGNFGLCRIVAELTPDAARQLGASINQAVGGTAIDTLEFRTAESDSSIASLDPVDSPQEDG